MMTNTMVHGSVNQPFIVYKKGGVISEGECPSQLSLNQLFNHKQQRHSLNDSPIKISFRFLYADHDWSIFLQMNVHKIEGS